MKICIIDLESYSTGGGAMIVSKQMSSALADMGHDVHLLCLSVNNTVPEYSDLNYSVHTISYPNISNSVFVSLLRKIKYIYSIYRTLVSIQPDIIHSQGLNPTYLTYIYSLKYHTHYCIGFHADPYLYADSRLSKIMLKYGRYFPFIKNSSASFSVSKTIIPTINQLFNIKPIYIANGADTKLFHPVATKKRSFNIISVSRMVHDKGLEDAILAMSEIIIQYPDAVLYLVGDGPIRHDLEKKVTELSLQKNVVFTGFIQNTELIGYYHNSYVYLLPSWNEAFSLVLFEAMGSGLPIVSTPVGIANEIITNDNGILVPLKSPHSIANAICKIFSLPYEDYRQISENNVKVTREYGWENIAKEYETVYYKCLHHQ